jgi:hypothetical protein
VPGSATYHHRPSDHSKTGSIAGVAANHQEAPPHERSRFSAGRAPDDQLSAGHPAFVAGGSGSCAIASLAIDDENSAGHSQAGFVAHVTINYSAAAGQTAAQPVCTVEIALEMDLARRITGDLEQIAQVNVSVEFEVHRPPHQRECWKRDPRLRQHFRKVSALPEG